MFKKIALTFLFLSLAMQLTASKEPKFLKQIPFTDESRWKDQDDKKVLIYSPAYRKLLFVSDVTKEQDNVVFAHRHTTERRNKFQLLLYNRKDRLYYIKNPYYNRYLFVSNDKKGVDHIVEAHKNSGEARNRFQLTLVPKDGLYMLANPEYACYTFVSNDTDGDDNYIEAHKDNSETRNHFAIMHIPELTSDYTSNWLSKNFSKIKEYRLRDLVLPGTHDSGTYNLTTKEADLDNVQKVIRKFSPEHVRKWARAQSESIYNQLVGGIRYFDLRPHMSGDKAYIHHGLRGINFSETLDDVARFITEKNRRELIILSISHFNNFKNDDFFKLKVEINKKLGQYLYRPPSFDPKENFTYRTLEEIMGEHCDTAKIILLTSDSKLNTESPNSGWMPVAWNFDTNIYDEWSNTDSFEQMKNDQVEKSKKTFKRMNKLFLLSWTLSPQIPRSVGAGKDLYDRDLHWLSRQANVSLPFFASRNLVNHYDKMPNILYVDFYKDAYVVETALMLNGLI